jgi:hypothetical protein
MLTTYIDADACPVKDEVYRVARDYAMRRFLLDPPRVIENHVALRRRGGHPNGLAPGASAPANRVGSMPFIKGEVLMSMRVLLTVGPLCVLAAFLVLAPGAAAPVPADAGGDFPQFVRVGRCELTRQDKEIVLKGPNGDRAYVLTTKEYKPPFALRVTAKTDSKNLRLHYNGGLLIFNWEGNEDELRIHDPATDQMEGVADQGKIEPDKYHDIAWEIYPDGMRVLVDGKERARRRGEYEKLQASAGIGPAFGSVITMKSFRVEPLKGKLPE